MQRRELLEMMINTALALGLLGRGASVQAHPHPCAANDECDAVSLRQKLRHWARYDGSELGVPMVLGLENLAAPGQQAPRTPDEFNRRLAGQFEHLVDLLLQFKPAPDESDVAALLVLMAESGLIPDAARSCV